MAVRQHVRPAPADLPRSRHDPRWLRFLSGESAPSQKPGASRAALPGAPQCGCGGQAPVPALPLRQQGMLEPHHSKATLQIPNRRRAERLPPCNADRQACARNNSPLPKIYAADVRPTPKSPAFHGYELARFLHSFRSGSSPSLTERMSPFPDILLPMPPRGAAPLRPSPCPSPLGVVYVRSGMVCYSTPRSFVSEEDCEPSRACRLRTNAGADNVG